jgi:hypothetical protein
VSLCVSVFLWVCVWRSTQDAGENELIGDMPHVLCVCVCVCVCVFDV